MTYGQISAILHNRISPLAVGWFMHSSPKDIPWQRVVNASGRCSTDKLPDFPLGMQRHILEKEGVRFKGDGAIDLKKYRYT
jgi:methylated-DNA-protein-cysteine methyltransferase-like protein